MAKKTKKKQEEVIEEVKETVEEVTEEIVEEVVDEAEEIVEEVVDEAEEIEEPKEEIYIVARQFIDRMNGDRTYRVGEIYIETDPERTKALATDKKSKLNTLGKIYITLGK